MTEFENAALCIFVVLITRVISAFDLNFYIPISKVCCTVGGFSSSFCLPFIGLDNAFNRSTRTCRRRTRGGLY
jgi:hypothetical protein